MGCPVTGVVATASARPLDALAQEVTASGLGSAAACGLPPGGFQSFEGLPPTEEVADALCASGGNDTLEVHMDVSAMVLFCGKVKINCPRLDAEHNEARTASVVQTYVFCETKCGFRLRYARDTRKLNGGDVAAYW